MDSSQQDANRRQQYFRIAILVVAVCMTLGPVQAADPFASDHGFMPITPRHKFVRISQRLRLLSDDSNDQDPDNSDRDADSEDTDADRADPDDIPSPSDDLRADRDSDDKDAMDLEDKDEDDSDGPLGSRSDDRVAYIENGRFILPALVAPSIATQDIGNGSVPDSFRDGELAPQRPVPESGADRNLDAKPWAWSVANWSPANTHSLPRYFEDRMLERHGHEQFPALQPICSGARFFATVPMLPYLMTLSDPSECESTLGYFRSGTCISPLKQRPPYSRRAAVAEAAALTGAILVLP